MKKPKSRETPVALSVDMDSPEDYQHFYRQPLGGGTDQFLDRVLGELLNLLAKLELKATLFAIGRDVAAPLAQARYREAIEQGHEVANHSWTHPIAFRCLTAADKRREIERNHRILEDRLGVSVQGFRCPAYDIDQETLNHLLDLGYRYDSSSNPTPFLTPMKWIVRFKSRRWHVGLGTLRQSLGRREPFFYWKNHRGDRRRSRPPSGTPYLVELPLSVLSPWRYPFYGTITQIRGLSWFEKSLLKLERERRPINYSIHAAELLDPETMGVVPGYGSPLARRRQVLEGSLTGLARRFRSVTLEELAEEWIETADREVAA